MLGSTPLGLGTMLLEGKDECSGGLATRLGACGGEAVRVLTGEPCAARQMVGMVKWAEGERQARGVVVGEAGLASVGERVG